MKVVTSSQMREIDNKAINEFKIPGLILMENAGREIFNYMVDHYDDDLDFMRIIIVCGKGNNGGDGFVLARHLYNNGYDIEIAILDKKSTYKGDARINLRALQDLDIEITLIKNFFIEKIIKYLKEFDLIVDAIFGTGFTGVPRGVYASVIDVINDLDSEVVSVDIPSGLNPDTGISEGQVVFADMTVTMGLPKLGMTIYPGLEYCGGLYLADISLPPELLYDPAVLTELIDEIDLPGLYRESDSHKGDYGKILLIGTSPGLTGAGCMAGEAALYSGAGLITLAVPASLNSILETKLTEVMTFPVPDRDGYFTPESLEKILEFSDKVDVVALGPGLGRYEETGEFVLKFLNKCTKPLILDADALFFLKDHLDSVKEYSSDLILTPHYGEFSRLTGKSIKEIKKNKVNIASEFAVKNKVILVLKGAETIIAAESGEVYINISGTPGMATGGMGDVLTGLIASFLGQKLLPVTAAYTASFILGVTAEYLTDEVGHSGITPTEIIQELPVIIKEYLEDEI
ncbi:NAD(P)H-hydrate dehydratase [Candidatus Dependentiae bacterium]|nr:NAD(P)H-hydrate dehydratase [Candidatus Dependentiae bacterium]